MAKLRSILFALLYVGLPGLLNGCQSAVLNPKGSIALDEKHLLITALGLMLLIVIPVIILSFVIAWKFRASNTQAKYTPDWSHNTLLEIVWWAIPCVIIAILAVLTWVSSHRLDPYKPLDQPGKPLVIQVVALEWKWLFIYPEQHIATLNFVQFPVQVPIRFLITSDAPMNSFQIPQLAGQIYAMAGMQTKLNLLANMRGDYRGLSTNYSGEGFSYMNFNARVSTQQAFDKWVKQVQQSPDSLTMATYNQLALPSRNNKPQYFSSINPDLFNTAIMKYMMPMQDLLAQQPHNSAPKQDVKAMKNMHNGSKDYILDRDYESRYNKNSVPPQHK